MKPPLRSPRRLILALLAWSPLAAGIIGLGGRMAGLGGTAATALLLPPLLAGSLLVAPTWYLCRAAPLRWRHVARLLLIHGVGGLLYSLLLVALAYLYALAADLLLGAAWLAALGRLGGLLPAAGWLIYLLAVLFHYLLLAVEETERREREAVENRLAASRAELRAFKATIHPHFLFNSLTALASFIASDPVQAKATCLDLADFLRYSLRQGEADWVRLGEEVAHVSSYLSIEKARRGERLKVEWDTGADAESFRVPALFLLPLVENAVKHGLGNRPQGGTVRISLHRTGEGLQVEVENPRPPADAPRPAGTGMGLRTLAARLALHYKRPIRPALTRSGEVVKVRLWLPAAREGTT